jgi:hypothetical protein
MQPTSPSSRLVVTLALGLALGGCSQKPKTQRFLIEGYGSGTGWTGYTLTVAGHAAPPAKPDDVSPPTYVDVPGTEQVPEGALVEFRWKTPCGEQVRSFPLPKPSFNEQGVMMVKVPKTLEAPPPITRVYFPRDMKGSVSFGKLTLDAPAMAEISDLACVKTATVGGREVPIPKLEPPLADERAKYARGDSTVSILVTDDASACFVDELVPFGTGEWARSWQQRLTGANVHVLAFASYDIFFEDIPDRAQVRGGSQGTSKTSLTRCAAP